MRSSGTLTAPRWTSPPNPVGTLSPVNVLKTVVLPEPANPTRPTFMEYGRCESRQGPWNHNSAPRSRVSGQLTRAEETSNPAANDVGIRRLVDSRQRVLGHRLSNTCPPVLDQR